MLDGRRVLLLCSNNYLGFADHPRVRTAAAEAAMRYGVGAGASRLVSGNMTLHRRLEERLADFEGSERCVLFGSGYLANTGVISALAREGDIVFSDALNHASIIDGCRLARAETFVYDHLDTEHLEWGLHESRGRGSLIVTDGVFSMDGDVAPLAEIVELARRYDARVLVDEAHATGALGPGGRGSVAAAGLEGEVDVIVGTLGKALGGYGAYACCDAETASYLVNTARTLIFSTGPPPPSVAAALAALELLRSEPRQVERLRRNARVLRDTLAEEGFSLPPARRRSCPWWSESRSWRSTSANAPFAAASSRRPSGRPPCRRARRDCGSPRSPRTRPASSFGRHSRSRRRRARQARSRPGSSPVRASSSCTTPSSTSPLSSAPPRDG